MRESANEKLLKKSEGIRQSYTTHINNPAQFESSPLLLVFSRNVDISQEMRFV